jgi:lipopolysaccharide heptosyltransferase II
MTAHPLGLTAPAVVVRPERVAAWATARSVLAVRLDGMGDVLMTTPALRAIRQSVPDARLTLLTSPAGAEVARYVPEIDGTLVRVPPWMKATPPAEPADELRWIEQLRAGRFDAAVVFTVHTQSPLPAALELWLAGIPLRLAHCRENPYSLLTDWVPEPEPDVPLRHEVRRQLDLVASVGFETEDVDLSFRVPPDDVRRIRARAAELGLLPGAGWGVLHPGATAPSRRYPSDRYLEAARRLAVQDGFRWVVTGSAGEAALVQAIAGPLGQAAVPMTGLSLGELAALLTIAPLLVTNNTGPAHLAAALGTPVVDLYALTNVQHTPWRVPSRVLSHDVPCRGCRRSECPLGHHLCLTGVSAADVVEAVRSLLAETDAARWAGADRGRSTAAAG